MRRPGERSHKMRSPRWVAADYKAEMTLGNRQPSSSTVDLRNQGITLLANRHAAALPRSSSVPTSSDRASQSRMSLDGTCICIGERSSSTRTSRRMRSTATVQERSGRRHLTATHAWMGQIDLISANFSYVFPVERIGLFSVCPCLFIV